MSRPRFDRVTALIVDDNKHMLSILKEIVRGFGIHRIYECSDAVEAFDIVRTEAVDIIIVDYHMHILDGTDFVRMVRTAEDSSNPFVPIIMVTAYSERSKVIEARDAGVTEFCCKPITARELYAKLVAVVNFPRSFVRTAGYFGPDRRRFSSPHFDGQERRESEPDQTIKPARVA